MGTNKAFLVGRMTAEADVKFFNSQNGEQVSVANFTIAVNRNFKNQAGEYEADFIRCQVRGRQADNIAKWTKKGSKIAVVGSIRTRSYDNQHGQRVYITEVDVSEVEYLDQREHSDQNQQPANGYRQGGQQPGGNKSPYQEPTQSTPNFAREESSFGANNPLDIDDLPF